jgi:hypothetical protein
MISREIDVLTVVPLPLTIKDFLFCWSGTKARVAVGLIRVNVGAVLLVKACFGGSTMCFDWGDEAALPFLNWISSFSALKDEKANVVNE